MAGLWSPCKNLYWIGSGAQCWKNGISFDFFWNSVSFNWYRRWVLCRSTLQNKRTRILPSCLMVGGNFFTCAHWQYHCFKEENAVGITKYFNRASPRLLFVIGEGLNFILVILWSPSTSEAMRLPAGHPAFYVVLRMLVDVLDLLASKPTWYHTWSWSN